MSLRAVSTMTPGEIRAWERDMAYARDDFEKVKVQHDPWRVTAEGLQMAGDQLDLVVSELLGAGRINRKAITDARHAWAMASARTSSETDR